MRKNLFFVLILMIFFAEAKAQKKPIGKEKEEIFKAAVLVLGNRNAAVAAAIQSAISGVNTTILLQAGGFDIVSPMNDLSSGFQDKFLKKYKEGFFLTKDSVELGGSFDKLKANSILKLITDSIKNLKVIRNVMWVKAERSGNNWNFKLSDGSTLKPKVLINAGDEKLNEALKIEVK